MIKIITNVNRKLIQQNLESEAGSETAQYIEDAINSLRDIRNHKISYNPITMTIEMIATRKACEVLEGMFEFIKSMSKPEVKIKDPRDTFI